MRKITDDWFTSARDDLNLIRQIIEKEDLTHLAAFHTQQAIEKIFKAIIEEFDLGFVKIHSLEALYGKVKDKLDLSGETMSLVLLDQLYIDSRYPGEMGLLPNGKPTVENIKELYDFAFQLLNKATILCR